MQWICDTEWDVNDGYRYHGFEMNLDEGELSINN